MAKQCMLTTIDNPYNPFEDYALWFLFDQEQGYNCQGLLARMNDYEGDDLSDIEEMELCEQIIDNIVSSDLNFHNLFKKVFPEDYENVEKTA